MDPRHQNIRPLTLRSLILSLALSLLSTSISPATAQRPSSDQAVDEVRLVSGKRLHGIVTDQTKTELTLFLEREWFEKTHPKLYATHIKTETANAKKATLVHLKRLDVWKRSRMLSESIAEVVDQEVKRLKEAMEQAKFADPAKPSRFTVIKIPRKDIAKTTIQSAKNHQVAGAAWKHNIDRVTSRTVTALIRELDKLKVAYAKEEIDFSDQFPNIVSASEEQWNARVALFEYALLDQCDFQGAGNNMLRIDRNNPNQAGDAIKQLLTEGLGGMGLGQLGGGGGMLDELMRELKLDGGGGVVKQQDSGWWKKAAATAQEEGFRGARLTKLVSNKRTPVAKVESWFIADVGKGIWKPVFVAHGSADRNMVDAAEVERIKADPQIQQLLKVFEGFQLGNNNLLDTALRQGAATDLAMKDADQAFFELLDQYTKRTDSPILKLKK